MPIYYPSLSFFQTSSELEKLIKSEMENQVKNNEPWHHCSICQLRLTPHSAAIPVFGGHSHTFVNPHGKVFHLRCFKTLENFLPYGKVFDDFTWFPGYSWQILLCAGCLTHLGWRYQNEKSVFFGLLRDRIK